MLMSVRSLFSGLIYDVGVSNCCGYEIGILNGRTTKTVVSRGLRMFGQNQTANVILSTIGTLALAIATALALHNLMDLKPYFVENSP